MSPGQSGTRLSLSVGRGCDPCPEGRGRRRRRNQQAPLPANKAGAAAVSLAPASGPRCCQLRALLPGGAHLSPWTRPRAQRPQWRPRLPAPLLALSCPHPGPPAWLSWAPDQGPRPGGSEAASPGASGQDGAMRLHPDLCLSGLPTPCACVCGYIPSSPVSAGHHGRGRRGSILTGCTCSGPISK